MSTTGQIKQLQQELQDELTTANQLLNSISLELQHIKDITNPGGPLESTIKHNTSLMKTLADLQKIKIDNLPPIARKHLNTHQNGTNVNDQQLINQNHLEIEEME